MVNGVYENRRNDRVSECMCTCRAVYVGRPCTADTGSNTSFEPRQSRGDTLDGEPEIVK